MLQISMESSVRQFQPDKAHGRFPGGVCLVMRYPNPVKQYCIGYNYWQKSYTSTYQGPNNFGRLNGLL